MRPLRSVPSSRASRGSRGDVRKGQVPLPLAHRRGRHPQGFRHLFLGQALGPPFGSNDVPDLHGVLLLVSLSLSIPQAGPACHVPVVFFGGENEPPGKAPFDNPSDVWYLLTKEIPPIHQEVPHMTYDLPALCRQVRRDILTMTHAAGSGHPGAPFRRWRSWSACTSAR